MAPSPAGVAPGTPLPGLLRGTTVNAVLSSSHVGPALRPPMRSASRPGSALTPWSSLARYDRTPSPADTAFRCSSRPLAHRALGAVAGGRAPASMEVMAIAAGGRSRRSRLVTNRRGAPSTARASTCAPTRSHETTSDPHRRRAPSTPVGRARTSTGPPKPNSISRHTIYDGRPPPPY